MPVPVSPSAAFVAGRVLFPFACGYFLSFLFRSINAVIAPNLQQDLGIGAGDLGVLTAAYFVTFAAAQLPVGILLDRFGPPRVQAGLMLIAAIGAGAFASADSLPLLALSRALIGLGVAGGLMSAMKAIAIWLPRERWALANGAFMAAGGLGALAATVPVEWGLQVAGWPALFWVLAVLSVLSAIFIFVAVPRQMGSSGDTSLAGQLRDSWQFLTDIRFIKIAPVSVVGMGSGMAIQTLWSGPYLRDVGGLGQTAAAEIQLLVAVALTAGFMVTGIAADRLQRLGVTLAQTMTWSTALYVICLLLLAAGWWTASPLLWIAFGITCLTTVLAYPVISADFPVEKSGRVNALLNAVVFGLTFVIQAGMGWIIDLWPQAADGHYPVAAYQWAFGIQCVLLVITLVWYAIPLRAPR